MSIMPPAAVPPRHLQPEIMDDPDLDAESHRAALRGLARLNRCSAAARTLLPEIRRVAANGPATLLDVATGHADLPVALARRARHAGLDLSIRACDVSPRAVEWARARAECAELAIEILQADALRDPLPEADVVTCSLFLHHLSEDDASRLLRRLAGAARRLLLVGDLRRSRWSTLLCGTFPRLLTTSRVVHVDAVRSARAAFTVAELRDLAARAGLEGARVVPRFPGRMLLSWSPRP